jgi:hypothetical protein
MIKPWDRLCIEHICNYDMQVKSSVLILITQIWGVHKYIEIGLRVLMGNYDCLEGRGIYFVHKLIAEATANMTVIFGGIFSPYALLRITLERACNILPYSEENFNHVSRTR